MTWLGRIVTFFPAFIIACCAVAIMSAVQDNSLLALMSIPGILYIVPPFIFKIHQLFFPLREGPSVLSDPAYSPWWGAYQIQLIYAAFPSLEAALRLIPGLYSPWLRLWGAKVGKNVFWTPRIEIMDRSLIEIGDDVVFGHRVICVSHVVDVRPDGKQILYVKRIKIGNRAFIGAESAIGPGCQVADGVRLAVRSELRLNQGVQS